MHMQPVTPWNPARTWVFAVGVVRYPEGQEWPEEGRRDRALMETLAARGVPSSQIAFATDEGATLRKLRREFERFLASIPADGTLWFYFAGHGTRDETSGLAALMLYDGDWTLPSLFAELEQHFQGQQALLFADCCYSGALGMEAMLRTGRVACGVLTSSQSSTSSTGDWTFTNCLIAGLRDEVPSLVSGDTTTSLLDLARYAEREMAMNHGQLATFASTNGFDPGLVLGRARQLTAPRQGEYVQARSSDGKFYPGRIERGEGGQYWIRWVGYPESDNEWVDSGNVRAYVPNQHPIGAKVRVQWKDEWFPAVVLTAKLGVHFVHYDDF